MILASNIMESLVRFLAHKIYFGNVL